MAMLPVRVSTLETEFDLKLKKSALAQNLFDTIISTTGIRETWYFGLHYTDTSNQEAWLRKEKKITQQETKNENPLKFQFKFKFFPENVTDEIIQDITLRLLFKQIRNDLLTEVIYCPAEKAVLLASFAVQAKYGDYDASKHAVGYLANEKLLPPVILSQHKLSIQEWEDKVSQFHRQHRTMSTGEAMLEYLKIAQDLEMFGITYFEVENAKQTKVWLGVDALGINFYDLENKFSPKVSFPWSEIAKVSYKTNSFTIRFTDTKAGKQVVTSKNKKTCKKIFYLATGNHDMYNRRRRPDTLDVQQMKAQKEQERLAREKERNLLKKEMAAREKLEKQQQEAEARYREMEADMEKRRRELEESKEKIRRLEEQLAETQRAREELERQQEELRAMLQKLEEAHEMDIEARERLEAEIKAKQEEIDQVREKVETQEEESRRLQEEVEEARKGVAIAVVSHGFAEAAEIRREPQGVQMNGDDKSHSGSSSSSSSSSSDNEDDDENKENGEHDNNKHGVPAIVVDTFEDEDREPDRKTEDLLKDLRSDLSGTKVEGTESVADRLYRENLTQGRDKFKTLREVRSGNTKRRIDTFENM